MKYDNLPIKPQNKGLYSQPFILPIGLCLNKYDWSKLEHENGKIINRLILAISRRLQGLIREILDSKKHHLNELPIDVVKSKIENWNFLPGFEPDGYKKDSLNIKVPLKSFEVTKHYYKALLDVLKVIYQLGVQFPVKTKDGIDYIAYKSLCSCYVPAKGKVDYVILNFDYDVLDALVNMDFGYNKISENLIVSAANSLPAISYRIHQLLISYDYAGKVELSIADFKDIIGVGKNTYKDFWRFKQKVLDRAKLNLDNLCKKGALDVCFSYSISDDKNKITLHVVHGDYYDNFHPLSIEAKQGADFNGAAENLFSYLQEDFGISDELAARIVKRTNDSNIQGALSREFILKEIFDNPEKKSKIKNPVSYVIAVFNNYFDGKEKLLDDAKKRILKEKDPADKWQIFISSMKQILDVGVYESTLAKMKFESLNKESILVQVANKNVYEEIEDNIGAVSYYLRYIFGDIKFQYRLMRK